MRSLLRLRRNLPKKLLFAAIAVCAFFALLEIAARVGLHVVVSRADGPQLREFREQDLVADRKIGWAWDEQQLFRGRSDVAPGKPPGLFRVVAIGDSCVWGALVRPESTFSAKLDALLKERYGADRVEVLNAGVVGYGTRQATAHLTENLAAYEPDLVLYYGTGQEAALWMRGSGQSVAPSLERLHPYLFRSKAFLVLNHAVRAMHRPSPPATYLEQNDDISALQAACEALGARLLLVEYLMAERAGITSDLDGVGYRFTAPVVRTLDAFREQSRPPRELIFDHEHPTPLGHSLIAVRLSERITREGWIE